MLELAGDGDPRSFFLGPFAFVYKLDPHVSDGVCRWDFYLSGTDTLKTI